METTKHTTLATERYDRNSLLGQIGNTPLLRLRNITVPGVDIFAKAEWFNPGGSVKDRAVLHMLLEAERVGRLRHDLKIIDATSGNTGIAYAMIGSLLGYSVVLAMPANASEGRKRILQAFGAELILTDPMDGTDGAQKKVKSIVSESPRKYFYPDQYNNPHNWKAHYETTAPEIWSQTNGTITHFVAGLGTTGTFIGTSRRLKELNPGIRCISVQPDLPMHGIEGLKDLSSAIVPGIYDPKVADEERLVSTEAAMAMTRRLAREEGLFTGVSSGAALAVALRIAQELNSGTIVTIFPDGGDKYLSEQTWHGD